MAKKIVAILGSYRKGGIIDQAVTEILHSAEAGGAQTTKIYLLDKRIGFCTNCRSCTQAPGAPRGKCVQQDDMESILLEIEAADAIVLGAPVNFFNINALTRRFMERLVCCVYWPWGQMSPTLRIKDRRKKAVLVTSSAMPGFMVRLFTGAVRALKIMAQTLGAKTDKVLIVGLAAGEQTPRLSARQARKAQAIGSRLARQG
jgi:multimeric flavodoxin WrbA